MDKRTMKNKRVYDGARDTVHRNLFTSVLCMLGAYAVFVISTFIYCSVMTSWRGIEVGIVLSLLAIIPHCLGKKYRILYFVSMIMNTVGSGFSVSAIGYEVSPKLGELITYYLPSVIFTLIICSVLFILSCSSENATAYGSIGAIAAGVIFSVVMLILWIRNGGFLFGFSFFTSVFTAILTTALALSLDGEAFVAPKYISFGSFGVFIIITVIVLLVLSDGELLDGLDIDLPEIGGKKNKNIKK